MTDRPGRELGAPADHVELPLERVLIESRGCRDEELADPWRRGARRVAGVASVDRDVAPANDPLPLLGRRVGEQLLELRAPPLVVRQEAHSDAVAAGRRQILLEHRPEERIRDLDEDARAVTRARVRSGGPPMLEVGDRGERALDRLVRRDCVETGHERDAAGVMLVRGVVEAGPRGHLASLSPVNELVRRGERSEEPASRVAGARQSRRWSR